MLVTHTRDDNLEFVWKFSDPAEGFLQFLCGPIVGHVSCMDEDIAIRHMASGVVIVSIGSTDYADCLCGRHGRDKDQYLSLNQELVQQKCVDSSCRPELKYLLLNLLLFVALFQEIGQPDSFES